MSSSTGTERQKQLLADMMPINRPDFFRLGMVARAAESSSTMVDTLLTDAQLIEAAQKERAIQCTQQNLAVRSGMFNNFISNLQENEEFENRLREEHGYKPVKYVTGLVSSSTSTVSFAPKPASHQPRQKDLSKQRRGTSTCKSC